MRYFEKGNVILVDEGGGCYLTIKDEHSNQTYAVLEEELPLIADVIAQWQKKV